MEYKSNFYTNCNCCFWYSQQRIGKRTGGHRNNRASRKIQNSALLKSVRILRRANTDMKYSQGIKIRI